MSSASAIPPLHVPSALQATITEEEYRQDEDWPTLSSPTTTSTTTETRPTMVPSTDAATEDWELLHPDHNTTVDAAPLITTTTSPTVRIRIVEPLNLPSTKGLPIHAKNLKHCQSSPDLRKYALDDDDDDASASSSSSTNTSSASSGVLVQPDDDASSSVVMVPSATTATTPSSPWGSKTSFKDTLMKGQQQQQQQGDTSRPQQSSRRVHHHHHRRHHHHHHHHHSTTTHKKSQPKFVVVETKPIRKTHSTGDLMVMEEEDVLGDTDAQLYYNQKAQGQLGRRNGRKQRPDEAKRLEITMAKKSMQRAATATATVNR
jgi:hypothetical protein